MPKPKNRRKKRSARKPSAMTYHVRSYRRIPAPEGVDLNADWYLICTNPNKERRAQLGLEMRGYKTFLPQVAYQSVRRERIVDMTRPLFPGYILVNLAGLPWYPIRRVDGVFGIVTSDLKPLALPRRAVEEIVRLSNEEEVIDPAHERPNLSTGDRARVCAGPFASFLSTVIAVLSGKRAQVLVDIFGRATPVEVDLAYLEAI